MINAVSFASSTMSGSQGGGSSQSAQGAASTKSSFVKMDIKKSTSDESSFMKSSFIEIDDGKKSSEKSLFEKFKYEIPKLIESLLPEPRYEITPFPPPVELPKMIKSEDSTGGMSLMKSVVDISL